MGVDDFTSFLVTNLLRPTRGARACFRCASYHVHGFPKRDPMQKSSSSMGYGNKTVRKALPKMLRTNTVTTTASHTGA
jgi:hypothetical protein